jgi:hypothetical protein
MSYLIIDLSKVPEEAVKTVADPPIDNREINLGITLNGQSIPVPCAICGNWFDARDPLEISWKGHSVCEECTIEKGFSFLLELLNLFYQLDYNSQSGEDNTEALEVLKKRIEKQEY